MNDQFRKRFLRPRHGEDHLQDVEAITLVLDNGERTTLKIADELAVPDDPVELMREAKRAPARMAFWAYQMERALATLRAKERSFAKCEGMEYMIARTYIQDHTEVEIATEGNIRSRVSQSPTWNAEKEEVERAQRSYGVLRAVREALEHRSHLLRRLIAHDIEVG